MCLSEIDYSFIHSFIHSSSNQQVLYLEVHEVEQLVDLGGEYLYGLLVDLYAVGLLVRLGLRDGAGAAAPRVQHHGVVVALLEHLVLGKSETRKIIDFFFQMK